jgi:hypothetical protein
MNSVPQKSSTPTSIKLVKHSELLECFQKSPYLAKLPRLKKDSEKEDQTDNNMYAVPSEDVSRLTQMICESPIDFRDNVAILAKYQIEEFPQCIMEYTKKELEFLTYPQNYYSELTIHSPYPSTIESMRFDSTGTLLAVQHSSAIYIYQQHRKHWVVQSYVEGQVLCMSFYPSEDTLFYSDGTALFRITDLLTNPTKTKLPFRIGSPTQLCVLPNGEILVNHKSGLTKFNPNKPTNSAKFYFLGFQPRKLKLSQDQNYIIIGGNNYFCVQEIKAKRWTFLRGFPGAQDLIIQPFTQKAIVLYQSWIHRVDLKTLQQDTLLGLTQWAFSLWMDPLGESLIIHQNEQCQVLNMKTQQLEENQENPNRVYRPKNQGYVCNPYRDYIYFYTTDPAFKPTQETQETQETQQDDNSGCSIM